MNRILIISSKLIKIVRRCRQFMGVRQVEKIEHVEGKMEMVMEAVHIARSVEYLDGLATAPREIRHHLLEGQRLEKEREQIKKAGFTADNPADQDVVSFACPVLSRDQVLKGALGCYAPEYRCPREKQGQILEALKKTAGKLSQLLPE